MWCHLESLIACIVEHCCIAIILAFIVEDQHALHAALVALGVECTHLDATVKKVLKLVDRLVEHRLWATVGVSLLHHSSLHAKHFFFFGWFRYEGHLCLELGLLYSLQPLEFPLVSHAFNFFDMIRAKIIELSNGTHLMILKTYPHILFVLESWTIVWKVFDIVALLKVKDGEDSAPIQCLISRLFFCIVSRNFWITFNHWVGLLLLYSLHWTLAFLLGVNVAVQILDALLDILGKTFPQGPCVFISWNWFVTIVHEMDHSVFELIDACNPNVEVPYIASYLVNPLYFYIWRAFLDKFLFLSVHIKNKGLSFSHRIGFLYQLIWLFHFFTIKNLFL